MSEDEKEKYRRMALEDKIQLGANYRVGRKRKSGKKNVQKKEIKSYNCDICEKVCKSYFVYKNHMLNIHSTDVRTEPLNAYTAFIQEEKKDTCDDKLDMDQARKKWKEITDKEKEKYRQIALEDKIQFGANYRRGRKWGRERKSGTNPLYYL